VRAEAHIFRSQVGIGSGKLLVRRVEENLIYYRFRCTPERRNNGRFSSVGGEGECGDK